MSKQEHGLNTPLYALAGLVIMVVAMLVLYLTDKAEGAGLLLAVAAAAIPSLIAALAAERTARDIRNGVVTDKARQGAVQAIEETEVITASDMEPPRGP